MKAPTIRLHVKREEEVGGDEGEHKTSRSGSVATSAALEEMRWSSNERGKKGLVVLMKVLLISQYFWPEPASIVPTLSRSLKEMEHRPVVLTGIPNYPAGEIYEGYTGGRRRREKRDGIQIIRVPLYPDHSANFLKRAANYLSFGISSAKKWVLGRRSDVVYVYATQMTAALGPWIWRRFGGSPYVLHVQDLWPESITGSSVGGATKFSSVIELLMTPWLSSVYRNAEAVIAISPAMAEALVSRGAPRERVHVVYNWADEAHPVRPQRSRASDGDPLRLVFAGNVGDMQDIGSVFGALEMLPKDLVTLQMVGRGSKWAEMKALAAKKRLTNVEFADAVPGDQVWHFYDRADVALVTLKNLEIFRATVPSKLQAALRNGLPVLTTVQGAVAQLVSDNNVGVVAQPEDPESIAGAIRNLAGMSRRELDEIGRRSRRLYERKFSMDKSIRSIAQVLSSAARDRISVSR